MNTPKESLVELARNLPEGATYDDIIYRLHVLSKTERGLRAEAEGRLISVEEARKRTSQWRSK
ncbi:MAG: hypothetical protein FJY67_01195 [Calditrichaeota bacterium]|nr:hypothetical protein [Calditrichota bacterium]